MTSMIKSDLTWSGTVVLQDDVQLGPNVQLKILPGTRVFGNGFRLEPTDQSSEIKFLGDRYNHIEVKDLHLFGDGYLGMNFVEMTGGTLLAPTGRALGMSFDIANSTFKDISEYVYAWYPNHPSSISGSSFDGLKFSVSGDLTVTNNIFANYGRTASTQNYDIASLMTAWNGETTFNKNTILNSHGQLLEVKYTSSRIAGHGNYFEHIAPDSIDRHLWDNQDDLNNPTTIDIGAVSVAESDNLFYQVGTWQGDRLEGTSMDDSIFGKGAADILMGFGGDDTIEGGSGDDLVNGAGGNDHLIGQRGQDEILGGAGEDSLFGGRSADLLVGGRGKDYLAGGSGNDSLIGGKSADLLLGARGKDILFGGSGEDSLFGGKGADILIGGRGKDILTGGPGSDIFQFNKGHGSDVIADWTDGIDLISFRSGPRNYYDLSFNEKDEGVWISYSGGKVLIQNFGIHDIEASDFIF